MRRPPRSPRVPRPIDFERVDERYALGTAAVGSRAGLVGHDEEPGTEPARDFFGRLATLFGEPRPAPQILEDPQFLSGYVLWHRPTGCLVTCALARGIDDDYLQQPTYGGGPRYAELPTGAPNAIRRENRAQCCALARSPSRRRRREAIARALDAPEVPDALWYGLLREDAAQLAPAGYLDAVDALEALLASVERADHAFVYQGARLFKAGLARGRSFLREATLVEGVTFLRAFEPDLDEATPGQPTTGPAAAPAPGSVPWSARLTSFVLAKRGKVPAALVPVLRRAWEIDFEALRRRNDEPPDVPAGGRRSPSKSRAAAAAVRAAMQSRRGALRELGRAHARFGLSATQRRRLDAFVLRPWTLAETDAFARTRRR